MTKKEIIDNIDNIARLNSETWRDREEVRMEIGKLLSELKKALEQPTINCNATTEEIAQSFIEDVTAVKEYLPSCNQMEFPKTFDEFANDYGFTDDKEIYTNGSHLIPVFRVKQWLDHIEQQPSEEAIKYLEYNNIDVQEFVKAMKKQPLQAVQPNSMQLIFEQMNRPTSDDCVSRQAIDHLCFEYLKPNTDDNIAFYEHFCDLPPVTPTQRWIPVSERLPASDEDVLVTNGKGMYIGWIDPTDKCWRVDSESEYFMNDIVAWQPLPKAYEEK